MAKLYTYGEIKKKNLRYFHIQYNRFINNTNTFVIIKKHTHRAWILMFPKGNIKNLLPQYWDQDASWNIRQVASFISTVIRGLCLSCTVGSLPILCLNFLAGDVSKLPFQKFPFVVPPSQQSRVIETQRLWAENSRTMNQTKE